MNTYIPRSIEPKLREWLYKGKIIVIYGARQTGKSTVVRQVLSDIAAPSRWFDGDEASTRRLFAGAEDRSTLDRLVGDGAVIVIDEAQKIENIGVKLKILIDAFPDRQIIATGSSSFDLANKLSEPLTGRTVQFTLYPLSIPELSRVWSEAELHANLPNLLVYGSYPSVVTASSQEEKTVLLKQLASDYLYKDVLSLNRVKKSEVLEKFTESISLQTGNEVSYNELSNTLQIGKQTVASYLDILEQGFIVFRLTSYSRNLRQEINRSRKVYITDTGIRNVLINNLNPLDLRTDVGAIWENFIVSEFKKQQFWAASTAPLYFWRTYSQEEIDLVKDQGGNLFAYEIKWQKPRRHAPKNWTLAYPNSQWQSITKDNFLEVLQ